MAFGFGPTEGKRRIYEYYVRECMVLILKGTHPTPAALHWPVCVRTRTRATLLTKLENLSKEFSPYPRRTRGSSFRSETLEDHVRSGQQSRRCRGAKQ